MVMTLDCEASGWWRGYDDTGRMRVSWDEPMCHLNHFLLCLQVLREPARYHQEVRAHDDPP